MDEKDVYIPPEVLSDLCSRFIINIPEEERSDLIRIFFQIEIAHWFYLDFYCESMAPAVSAEDSDNLIQQQPTSQQLKPCSIKKFAEKIFRHCPFLMEHSGKVDEILSKWKVFKHAVPTNGAIILDESMRHVLLVQGFWAKASWGFPKGKVVEEESEARCAIREVLEETGYDISDKLVEDHYLEITINDQVIRLYIITNVSKSTKFEPKTRREIKEARWFAIDELPVHRKDIRTKQTLGYSPNSFFMVMPFMKALKQWIHSRQMGNSSLNSSKTLNQSSQRPHSSLNHMRTTSHTNNGNNGNNGGGHSHHHHHHDSGHRHHHHHHQHNNSFPHGYSSNNNIANMSSNEKSNFKNSPSSNNVQQSMNASSSNDNSQLSKYKNRTRTKNAFLKQHVSSNKSMSNTSQSNNNNADNYDEKTPNERDRRDQLQKQQQQQSQYYQKLHREEFADLLKFKDTNKSSKYQKDSNQTKEPNFKIMVNHDRRQRNNNRTEFKGPECWTNFKFDYYSILKVLPPLIDLNS